jgi:hypothetical protein
MDDEGLTDDDGLEEIEDEIDPECEDDETEPELREELEPCGMEDDPEPELWEELELWGMEDVDEEERLAAAKLARPACKLLLLALEVVEELV